MSEFGCDFQGYDVASNYLIDVDKHIENSSNTTHTIVQERICPVLDSNDQPLVIGKTYTTENGEIFKLERWDDHEKCLENFIMLFGHDENIAVQYSIFWSFNGFKKKPGFYTNWTPIEKVV